MKMPLSPKTLLAAGVVLLLTAGAAGANCGHKADRDASEDAAGVKRVVVVAEAGDLVVHGKSGAGKIVVHGEACADSASQLDKIQVDTRRSGDTVTIKVRIDRESNWGWGNEAWLDLDVEMPPSAELELEDGSGDTVLRDLGNVRFEDGSGDVRIEKVASLRLKDGSGDVEISDSGDLILEDGSGDLLVHRVKGDVTVEDDGSGDLDFEGVQGSVRVRSDGSGSIYVADVSGDLTVDDDGSGGIDYKNVRGKVSVPAAD